MNHIKCFNLITTFYNLRLVWLICVRGMSLKDTLPRYDKVSYFDMIHVLEKTLSKHIILHTIIRSYQTKNQNAFKTIYKTTRSKNERSKIGQNNLRPDIHLFKNLDWEKLHKILLIKPRNSIIVWLQNCLTRFKKAEGIGRVRFRL